MWSCGSIPRPTPRGELSRAAGSAIESSTTTITAFRFSASASIAWRKNAAFAKKFDFNFPLLCDTDRAVGLIYGACDSADAQYANRISFLIDGEGKIVKAYPNVDASKHPEEVLKDF